MKTTWIFTGLLLFASLLNAQETGEKNTPCNFEKQLELCLVVDATGSMKPVVDELKGNFSELMTDLQNQLPDYQLKLGLVLFRDREDEYMVRKFDFTADWTQAGTFLKEQFAVGGGDEKEAVLEALSQSIGMNWSKATVSPRVILLLSDEKNLPSILNKTIADPAEKMGINWVIPVLNPGKQFDLKSIQTEVYNKAKEVEFANDCTERGNSLKTFIKAREQVFIYPNPANEYIACSTPNIDVQYFSLKILDVNGKTVLTAKRVEDQTQINISHLPAGHYVVFIKNQEIEKAEKLSVIRP
ncbi:MAG TPA: T9SS type A sorting domain-containing protein [Saprospiraceae bacterium]|nr:T9SS type A sorting domain-containing protein [Saprospiraceae bacterium]